MLVLKHDSNICQHFSVSFQSSRKGNLIEKTQKQNRKISPPTRMIGTLYHLLGSIRLIGLGSCLGQPRGLAVFRQVVQLSGRNHLPIMAE